MGDSGSTFCEPYGTPKLVATVAALRTAVKEARAAGRRIGCVPTMGALHEGHLSLVEASKRDDCFTVATIFVNPLQFGPKEDFNRYPRQLDQDLAMLKRPGADLVFAPSVEEVYPRPSLAFVEVEQVDSRWEGPLRPGHFRGVATVVAKLFNLVLPDAAYFGQKDFQQTVVVRRMIEDLNFPVELHVQPTLREADGLAMSSRNVYLSVDERREAVGLHHALEAGRRHFLAGERSTSTLLGTMQAVLARHPKIQPEYLAVVDPDTLEPLETARLGAAVLIAAKVGSTRLLDNIVFT